MRNSLKKMNEERETLTVEMENLLSTVETEERAFTEEEETRFSEIEQSIKRIDSTIEAITKDRNLKRKEEGDEGSMNNTEEEKRALQEATDTKVFADFIRNAIEERADVNLTMGNNGAVVPTTIANKIISKMYDISPILEKATRYKTKGKLSVPIYGADASNNDIVMAYADEFTELESKVGKFTSVDLGNHLAGVLAKLSNSLINNTDIDITNKVIELVAEAGVRFLEGEALNGTTGKAEGLSKITLKVIAAAGNVITADELIKVKNKVKKAFRKDSIWIMSNDTLTAVELLKDANGRYLFTEDLTGEFDGKLLGYPVYVSDNAKEIAPGATPIHFGDFSGLAIKQSQDLEIQVLREKYATQHATGVVAWTEFDMKVEHLQKIAKLEMGN